MITVKLSTTSPEWPWLRQTPNSRGVWGRYRFFVDTDTRESDYWVVYQGLCGIQRTFCPPRNTILITAEPLSELYPARFLKQFETVVTFHRDLQCRNVVYSQPALPWHVGRRVSKEINIAFSKDYDELKSIQQLRKDKTISVITSSKSFYPGHVKRIEFVRKLAKQERFDVDIFGRGIRDIEDKWDAIARYKYHIAVENSRCLDYFTEKLTDAFLGGAYPLYYGCTNVEDYFPHGSLRVIDIDDFEASVGVIENVIRSECYEQSIDKIQAARELVLEKYNLFPTIIRVIEGLGMSGGDGDGAKKKEVVTLLPGGNQSFPVGLMRKVKRQVSRLLKAYSGSHALAERTRPRPGISLRRAR